MNKTIIILVLLFKISLFSESKINTNKNKSNSKKLNIEEQKNENINLEREELNKLRKEKKELEEYERQIEEEKERKKIKIRSIDKYIYFQAGTGFSLESGTGRKNNFGKFGIEFLLNKILSIGLGFSNSHQELYDKNRYDNIRYLYAFRWGVENGLNNAEKNPRLNALNLLILGAASSSPQTNYNYQNFHLDLKFKLEEDKFINPIYGIGFFMGGCLSNQIACRTFGVEYKAGLELNFQTHLLFLYFQYQDLKLINLNQNVFETNIFAENNFKLNNYLISFGYAFKF